jgi:hypothetical protein
VFEDGTGQMKVHSSKTHKYLGMLLDFNELVVAYDKALTELSDEFSAVK